MYDFDFQEVTCDCCTCISLNSNSAFPQPNFMLLRAALSYIDSNCDYDTLLLIGAIIFNESGGNEEGLDLFDSWSGEYLISEEVYRIWLSYNYDRPWPAKLKTLRDMLVAEGVDWSDILTLSEDEFFRIDVLVEDKSL
jgi:hypothetical protein